MKYSSSDSAWPFGGRNLIRLGVVDGSKVVEIQKTRPRVLIGDAYYHGDFSVVSGFDGRDVCVFDSSDGVSESEVCDCGVACRLMGFRNPLIIAV
jgi:hypothetical protein